MAPRVLFGLLLLLSAQAYGYEVPESTLAAFKPKGTQISIIELVDINNPSLPPACQQSVTTVNGVHKCQNELIFEDNFSDLERPKWENVIQFGGDPSFPFVTYTNQNENCFVKNGFLNIKPTLQIDHIVTSGSLQLNGCTGAANTDECYRQAAGGYYLPPVLSAKIRTKQSFNFRYGKVEVKAKLPLGDWIFSEILLLPKELAYGSNPKLASGQMNIALLRGNKDLSINGQQIGANCLHGFSELASNTSYPGSLLISVGRCISFNEMSSSLWGNAFHTYGATWTPDFISFTVDGSEIGRITPPNGGFQTMSPFSGSQVPWGSGSKFAPFDKEFYLSIGLGVGGFTAFPDDCLSRVGNTQYKKPWRNGEVKAIGKFWSHKNMWYPTWDNTDSTLQVDYVRVWAL